MIETIRKAGQEFSRTWNSLAEGWRDLWRRSGSAITRFLPREGREDDADTRDFPTWALLAGEIADTGAALVIRLELPGIDRDDCEVELTSDWLRVYGEKRVDRELINAAFYVRERAYGRFQRNIPLPLRVDPDRAQATFRSGVLTVKAPKLNADPRRRLAVE
jgi:HSP20 family protein